MDDKENKQWQNKIPIVQQASEYLEKHQIYELLSSLMSSLAINRPSSPIDYIIQKLASDDPCKICVISNHKMLSEKCSKMLENQFKAKIYSFDDIKENEIDDQIKNLQTETNFIIQNYPTNKKQALNMLDMRIIPDRIFLISNENIDNFDKDIGNIDLLSLCKVFKHNTRIICCNDIDDSQLEELLLSEYYEQRKSYNNYLAPKFAPRVLILGPPNIGKTKLALYLKDRMNINYLNAKHIMNQHIQTHTKFGIEAEKIILEQKDKEKHFFVENDLIVEMIAYDTFSDKDILRNGYVLDNFPRTVEQANCLIKFNVNPNRIIVLTAKDSTIIEKGEKCKYLSDDIETPGISYDDKSDITVHGLLDGFKQNVEDIKSVLCDKKAIGCGVRIFNTEITDWDRILDLSYDFIIQPLPKQ